MIIFQEKNITPISSDGVLHASRQLVFNSLLSAVKQVTTSWEVLRPWQKQSKKCASNQKNRRVLLTFFLDCYELWLPKTKNITITWFERATWLFDSPRNIPRSGLTQSGGLTIMTKGCSKGCQKTCRPNQIMLLLLLLLSRCWTSLRKSKEKNIKFLTKEEYVHFKFAVVVSSWFVLRFRIICFVVTGNQLDVA